MQRDASGLYSRHRGDGTALKALAAASALVSLYRAMVLTRTFELKAVSLQRTGRLGSYAVSLGQEAVSVGVASAMRQEDVLSPPIATAACCSGAG